MKEEVQAPQGGDKSPSRKTAICLLFGMNLSDAVITVGLVTFSITFSIFFALHSPGQLEREDGFRQVPTISLTGCYSPANFIFTGGMHLLAVLLFFLFNAVYLIYETRIRKAFASSKSYLMSEKKYQSSLYWNGVLWYFGIAIVLLLAVTGSVPVTVAGDVHSPAAFFFFFIFIIHIHMFYFKVSQRGQLVTVPAARWQLKMATFSCMSLPFLLLVLSEVFLSTGDRDIYTQIAINIHVIVEYIATAALAVYIFSFREDLHCFSVSGSYDCGGEMDVMPSSSDTVCSEDDVTAPLITTSS